MPDVKAGARSRVDHYVTKPVPYPKLLAGSRSSSGPPEARARGTSATCAKLSFMRTALLAHIAAASWAQSTVTVRPRESDEVLVNPRHRLHDFQRFNGDNLNTQA